jgi:hypothetical protein
MSGDSSGSGPLIQNGITVCYNVPLPPNLGCPSGASYQGTYEMTWDLWYTTITSSGSINQVFTSTDPTHINGTYEEYITEFLTSNTQPTFLWGVNYGSTHWSLMTTITSPFSATTLEQAEGIFEASRAYQTGSNYDPILKWSSNPAVLDGFYDGSGGSATDFSGGTYVLYTLTYGSGNEAIGGWYSSTQWEDTWQ